MRTAQRGKVTGSLVHRVPSPDRTHGHGQPAAGRLGEVSAGGGDDADGPNLRRQRRRSDRIALVVAGMPVVGELDADPVAAEPVHQIGKRLGRRIRPALGKRLADMAFAASGQNVPVPAGGLGQRVVVVVQLAFLTARQMRLRELARQPPVSLRAAGEHQQMRSRRVGVLGSVTPAQRQFSAEHRGHLQFLGGLGEAHHPVEPVVIGQRDRAQVETDSLLDEFLRRAGTVEEAVRRMRVQFRIRHRRHGPVDVERLVGPPLS